MANPPLPTATELARENEQLRQQLQEAEDLITAIRTGTIDALAVQGTDGPRIFTLEGADQSYRNLIEQMNEGALLLGQDTTVLYCNACLAGLVGAPLEEVMGSSFTRFVPTEFQGYWEGLLTAGWAAKSKGEMPLRSQDGRLQPFALALNVLLFNETPVLAVIVTDVSERREVSSIRARAEAQNALLARTSEELRVQSQARLVEQQAAAETSRILEGIPHIAWTANPDGISTYLNRRWFDYAGQPGAETVANRILERVHPDDLRAAENWFQALHHGEATEVECRLCNASGDYRWMLGRALPSRNEHGDIIQWIGTYTDIHEHKLALDRIDQAQRQLRQNNFQLTRVNTDLDNFIYTASHDLRAPITNIEGLLQALELELPPDGRPGEVAPILAMMQDSVDRFKRTIEQLTDVSKLQKANVPLGGWASLNKIIQDVQLDLKPLIKKAQARIEVHVEDCPNVVFSEKNLRSVVYNLLSNALKYRAPDRTPYIRIACRLEDAYSVLTVQDNGLGLNLTNDHKLFTMFQRLHDHVEGSGIGLYMIKRMVENEGGRIEVESEVGVGSTFSVYFLR